MLSASTDGGRDVDQMKDFGFMSLLLEILRTLAGDKQYTYGIRKKVSEPDHTCISLKVENSPSRSH